MPDTMSVAILLRQRKQRKMARKLGISSDALWHVKQRPKQPPLSPNALKMDFEMAKRQFTFVKSASSKAIQDIRISEPEEVEVETQKEQRKLSHEKSDEHPVENSFFQLPSTRKITDEQIYEEFKTIYISQGVERELWRRRRYQKRTKRSRKGTASK